MPNALAGDWMGMLAFFPLWAVNACFWFGLACGPKKISGPRVRKLVDGAAVALSICSAMAILIGLNCEALISLPFLDQACRTAELQQLLSWTGS